MLRCRQADKDLPYRIPVITNIATGTKIGGRSVIDGAKAAAEAAGAKITCIAPDDITDAAQQVQMIEDFISQDVDILIVDPNIADSVVSVLDGAVEKGIKVVLVDTDSPNFTGAVTYVGTANYDAAYEGATEFASRLKEGANVVIATGQQGDDNHEKRSAAYKDAMEAAGCTVLDLKYCDNSADLTAAQVEDWIQKYGVDGIDAVMRTDDDASMGAVQALAQNGASESIKVCSFNGFQVAISKIGEGLLEMTIAQQPYIMGEKSVECGLGALEGETYDEQIPIDVEIIDASNWEEFVE
ncbi:MAG: sugar ABC transporter substrate-binding protein [Lachnospiraceae bacterium]